MKKNTRLMRPAAEKPQAATTRLNRFLAEAGVCSRREADEYIFRRQVTVNGAIAELPALRIDPERDAVKVAGRRVKAQPLTYILLNKPEGVISTTDDPEKRTTVIDLVRDVRVRVFPVGRLDFNTTGVMLLTNDGDLALRLMHPRYGFDKTYQARVFGAPSPAVLKKLCQGVRIPAWGGRWEKTLPARVRLLKRFGRNALLEISLREGRQHQVKKMCAAIGLPVEKLCRIKFGFLTASGLAPGQWRYLQAEEIQRLRQYQFQSQSFSPSADLRRDPRAGSRRRR
ncbi:rRNA pseudouridine synthase [candidate division FCPU426 bacterium]|nr:rRNA pseudouridine synthase [candidate division FCPU426 bacterium]